MKEIEKLQHEVSRLKQENGWLKDSNTRMGEKLFTLFGSDHSLESVKDDRTAFSNQYRMEIAGKWYALAEKLGLNPKYTFVCDCVGCVRIAVNQLLQARGETAPQHGIVDPGIPFDSCGLFPDSDDMKLKDYPKHMERFEKGCPWCGCQEYDGVS
jgi:hypothetical protein